MSFENLPIEITEIILKSETHGIYPNIARAVCRSWRSVVPVGNSIWYYVIDLCSVKCAEWCRIFGITPMYLVVGQLERLAARNGAIDMLEWLDEHHYLNFPVVAHRATLHQHIELIDWIILRINTPRVYQMASRVTTAHQIGEMIREVAIKYDKGAVFVHIWDNFPHIKSHDLENMNSLMQSVIDEHSVSVLQYLYESAEVPCVQWFKHNKIMWTIAATYGGCIRIGVNPSRTNPDNHSAASLPISLKSTLHITAGAGKFINYVDFINGKK